MTLSYSDLTKISNNPSRVISTIFNDVENAFLADAGTLNSTDHPFAYAIDLMVGTQYGFITRLGDVESGQHKVHARNIGDLAKVMSDEDWYGVFASPSGTTIRYIISKESLDRYAIRYSDVNGNLNNTYRKLVLPPDMQVSIAGIPFLLENPVEIRVMDHGGYEVVYDSSRQSRLNALITNTPETSFLDINGKGYLSIELPVRQLLITPHNNKTINQNSGFRETIEYTEGLYAIRAFITPDLGTTRSEMAVVFNNEYYDPNQATLVIDLKSDTSFEASIPPVYVQNGMITSARVTILVYTTKGEYYRDFSTLQNQYFKAEYFDYANNGGMLNTYEAPFVTINDVLIDSVAPITGGRTAMSFAELKDLVIYGHRQRLIPVSNSDIAQFMITNGYSSIKSIDMITERLYRVTKDLPIQDSKLYQDSSITHFNSSMGTNVGSILTSLEELVASGWGIDNGSRVTILQRAAFNITDQTAVLISKNEFETLMGLSNQGKIDTLENKTFVYNPFTYVFDTTKSRASCRIYRTSLPTILYQTFRFENSSLGLQVSVGQINIQSTPTSYIIQIQTTSSDAYKNLPNNETSIQLSFQAVGSSTPITMKANFKGKTQDGERVFEFVLPTKYDITDAHQIAFGGFNQFGKPQDKSEVDLQTTASFIFTYSGSGVQLLSPADMKIDQTLFNSTTIAIIETEYKTEFGRHLESLYTRIRPITGEAQYQKYTSNVAETYAQDVYEYKLVTNPDGSKINKLVIKDGKAVILHNAGSQVFAANGDPVWKFLKGQTVYDSEGNPVLLEPRKMKYYWDFIGFDFNYMVSQDEYDTEYMTRIENFFVDDVVAQLDKYNKITLDETRIVFKPRSTMGFTTVYLNEAIQRIIKNDLNFSVVYMMTKEGLRNQNLKENLTTSTHNLINTATASNTVSLSTIISILKANAGNEVIDVSVVIKAGTTVVDAITNVDTTNGFSVAKSIEQTADKFLTIKEDIDIQFKRHLPDVVAQ